MVIAATTARVRRSPYEFEHIAHLDVDAAPELVWSHLAQFDRYPVWWPWLREFAVDGTGLGAGTVLRGVIRAPVPPPIRLDVALTERTRTHVEARVRGDLAGPARLGVEPLRTGTRVTVWWHVEITNRAMRAAARATRPLLLFAHDRAVARTIESFRRNLRRDLAA